VSDQSEPVQLIDSHSHIYGDEFSNDFNEMLERASQAGLKTIIVVGTDLESSKKAIELSKKHDNIFCAIGVHPHDAENLGDDIYEKFELLAKENEKVVAIGEIGLDFYRNLSPRNEQEKVFRNFIKLGRALNLPLIIHDRDAHNELILILEQEKAEEVGGILHCFSGNIEMAEKAIQMGFYISIPGTITYKNSEPLREVVKKIKIEHLLVETDSPYLSPEPYRGKRNEPANVRITAEKIAEIKGLTLEDVARITTLNVETILKIGNNQQSKLAYKIRNSLYLNITNRCSNQCSFCAKFDNFRNFTVKGHHLKLSHEPSKEEILKAVRNVKEYDEIVFCGYGEPLLRVDTVTEVAKELKKSGVKIRINTDGQANLVHGRNILPDLAGLVDTISVSLNAADAGTYNNLCNTPFNKTGFKGVCDFIKEAKKYIPNVIATAVTVPGLDIMQVRNLAESLGATFREREYSEIG